MFRNQEADRLRRAAAPSSRVFQHSNERMDGAAFAELGATMRQRSGTVDNWLKGLSAANMSRLIQRLKWECRLNRTVQRLKEPE